MIRVAIIEDDVRIASINQRFVEKVEGFEVIGIATDRAQAHERWIFWHLIWCCWICIFPICRDWICRGHSTGISEYRCYYYNGAKEFDTVREAIRGGVYDFMIKPVVFDRFQEKLKAYRKYYEQMKLGGANKQIDQQGIDQLLWRAGERMDREVYFPKGIDKLTSEKILSYIEESGDVWTAEELGKRGGFSRTTARRYLEYFVEKGVLVADISYGTVGRPERVYRKAED